MAERRMPRMTSTINVHVKKKTKKMLHHFVLRNQITIRKE